jgi:hypothetical protein
VDEAVSQMKDQLKTEYEGRLMTLHLEMEKLNDNLRETYLHSEDVERRNLELQHFLEERDGILRDLEFRLQNKDDEIVKLNELAARSQGETKESSFYQQQIITH